MRRSAWLVGGAAVLTAALGHLLLVSREPSTGLASYAATQPAVGASQPTLGAGGRIIARVRPEERKDGRPLTAEEIARRMAAPGLVSLATAKPELRSSLSEVQKQVLATRHEQREAVRADLHELKTEFRQSRRAYRDRTRPRVGMRYGENRDKVRELRHEYRRKRAEVLGNAPRIAAQANSPAAPAGPSAPR